MICNFTTNKFCCYFYNKWYKNIQQQSIYTYHLSVFNSTKTIRSIHSCVFYFKDNGIAGIEESSELFFHFHFHSLTACCWSLSDPWSSSNLQPINMQWFIFTMLLSERSMKEDRAIILKLKQVFDLKKQHLYRVYQLIESWGCKNISFGCRRGISVTSERMDATQAEYNIDFLLLFFLFVCYCLLLCSYFLWGRVLFLFIYLFLCFVFFCGGATKTKV